MSSGRHVSHVARLSVRDISHGVGVLVDSFLQEAVMFVHAVRFATAGRVDADGQNLE